VTSTANKLSPNLVAWSLAAVAGIANVACAILFTAAPEQTLNFFNGLFHGIDLTGIVRIDIILGSMVLGFFETVISAFILGWLFATIYNNLASRMK